jgi:hypothetical protein
LVAISYNFQRPNKPKHNISKRQKHLNTQENKRRPDLNRQKLPNCNQILIATVFPLKLNLLRSKALINPAKPDIVQSQQEHKDNYAENNLHE